ncbi:MAG: nitrous oxide reductase accessory protein NosL [Bacteroidetes bacterium]|nr:nitrous oxide reductase accessory protein NosL [Bacteroidota bacterium]
MKKEKIPAWMRILLVLGAVALAAAIILPIWRIELDAPQYPEGLAMQIYSYKLGGSIDIINGLNHYIGMRTLHESDFIEFTVLPYLIGFFALFTMVVALLGRKKPVFWLTGAFLLFAIVSIVDFWKWEYNYGHNLDPNAPIQVPGMSYQPPLIGFKQLLNFGAFSIPDIGGWLMAVAGGIMALCVFMLLKKQKKLLANTSAVLLLMALLSSCSQTPSPIKLNKDQCDNCKMTIADQRFGAEIVSKKGKIWKFDDTNCLAEFLEENRVHRSQVKDIFLVGFDGAHDLLKLETCLLYQSEELKSPMGGNVAAFADKNALDAAAKSLPGTTITPAEIGL